jgi:hypothetical protein
MGAADTPMPGSAGRSDQTSQPDSKLELYKLEYERAAIRYEDIYKAVWQIFSYMTAVTAAFLAFGGDRFQENLFWFLATAPLVYWFFGTYIPLNTYGDDIGATLCNIEKQLNSDYGVHLNHYRSFQKRTTKEKRWHLRVRHVVLPVFWILTIISAYELFRTTTAVFKGTPMVRAKPTEVKIVTVDSEELKKLIETARDPHQSPAVPPTSPPPNGQPK